MNDVKDDVIWTQLEDIGIKLELILDIYFQLVDHPETLKRFNGIPIHKRKKLLHHIVPIYPPSV